MTCTSQKLSVFMLSHFFSSLFNHTTQLITSSPYYFNVRPLKNALFCPISVSGSNFNPRNTQCMPVVKIFAFLDLEQNRTFFNGLNVFEILKPVIIYYLYRPIFQLYAQRTYRYTLFITFVHVFLNKPEEIRDRDESYGKTGKIQSCTDENREQ